MAGVVVTVFERGVVVTVVVTVFDMSESLMGRRACARIPRTPIEYPPILMQAGVEYSRLHLFFPKKMSSVSRVRVEDECWKGAAC